MGFDLGQMFGGLLSTVEQFDPLNLVTSAAGGLLNDLGVPKSLTDGIKVAVGSSTGDVTLAAGGMMEMAQDCSGSAPGTCGAPPSFEYPPPMLDAAPPPGYADNHDFSPGGCAGDDGFSRGGCDLKGGFSPASWDAERDRTQRLDLSDGVYTSWKPTDPRAAGALNQGQGPLETLFESPEQKGAHIKGMIQSNPEVRRCFENDFGCNVIPGGRDGGDDLKVRWRGGGGDGDADDGVQGCGRGDGSCDFDPFGDGISQVMNGPGDLEDKVMALLESAETNEGRQLEGAVQDLQRTSQQKGQSGQPSPDLQQAQFKVQELMQQRQAMYETMSNVSKDFAQMSMAAVQNIRG